jgi:glycosyltransferase involved in cell wall biosynthesis
MKICHVIGTLQVGGAEKQYINQINALSELGHEIHAVVLSQVTEKALLDAINGNIKIHFLPVKLIKLPLVVARLMLLFRRHKIEVVHAHMFWASLYAALAARLSGIKVLITTEHGMNPWKKKVHYWAERIFISSKTYKRICVSKDILDNRVARDRLPAEQLLVLPNGVKVNDYCARHWSSNEPVRLVAVGRLIEAKDYGVLFEAIGLLPQYPLQLSVLGEGELHSDLQALIHKLDLGEKISLLGNQDDPISWLYNSHIFVMSSKREGQPMALLEAMSTGIPIVSTNVGGIKDTLNDLSALLVEADDAAVLAVAIKKMIGDVELANHLGRQAFNDLVEHYAINSVTIKLLDIYKNGLADYDKK